MTNKEKLYFFVSLLIAFLFWCSLYGVYLGSIFVVSLAIHEYGHYYWMGKEGLLKRSMIMIPPLGALAITKDIWPSRAAEAKIALAGPFFGLFSLAIPFFTLFLKNDEFSRAGILLICWINLFNLILPIAILDGGRVIKSLMFSINRNLGLLSYWLSYIGLFLLASWMQSFLALIISFYLLFGINDEHMASLQNPSFINLKPMSKNEMAYSFLCYLFLVSVFSFVLYWNDYYIEDLILLMSSNTGSE